VDIVRWKPKLVYSESVNSLQESHTLPRYSMLKLHHHFGQTLVFSACFIATGGCDSLERITPRNIDNMSEKGPILGIASNGNPASDVTDRRRLIDSYVEYWPLISSEDQHERLPKVLKDPIPELRAFGVERVAILLRDGEALDEELQLVVKLIKDKYQTVQITAAKLLPEINVVDLVEQSDGTTIGLSEFVALALKDEERQGIAALELEFFQTRPHPDAVDPSISRLRSGPVGPAAKTLFALLNADMVSDDQKNRIFKHVQRSHLSISKLPSFITLNAMLSAMLVDTKVQQELIPLLKSPDKSIAMAVDQGFASAGFAEHETILYGPDSIQDLIEQKALDAEDDPDWDAAVFAVAIKLDITSLIHADDMLKDRDMSSLRHSILQAVDAYQEEDLLTRRFNAAIAASEWDAAEATRTVPEPWIEAWKLKADEPTTADAIKKQIILRFQDKLTASERELLDPVDVDVSPEQNP